MYKRIDTITVFFTIAIVLLLGFHDASAQKGSLLSGNDIFGKLRILGLESNPAADLDQCANGGVGAPAVVCSGAAWQNGNLGQSQAHYLEGEAVPYRLRFSNLSIGSSYTVTIEWDTTENSGAKHALDCLTSFDMTETDADPCSGVAGCNSADKNTFAIPPDSHFTAGHDGVGGTSDDIPFMAGDFTLFNGVITAVSDYTLTGSYAGASQTRITITFTAEATNPVLAWGGHISTRMNWGTDNSAIAIAGSPYHMRLIDLNGAGGNQDRSLSSAATIFPGKITIVKDARPNTAQAFNFTSTGPGFSDFSLTDDGSNTANSQLFDNLTNFGSTNKVSVTEQFPFGNYFLTQLSCTEDPLGGGGQQNSTVNVQTRTAEIILEEGEAVTCTFVNAIPTASTAIITGRVLDIYGRPVKDASIAVANSAGVVRTTRPSSFGYYTFAELPVGETYVITVRSRRYTFANDSIIVVLMNDLSEQNFTAIPFNY